MTVLLDTHALLFWLFDDPRLSASARAVLADPTVTVLVSSVSAYEICIKHRLGKLSVAEPLVGDIPGGALSGRALATTPRAKRAHLCQDAGMGPVAQR